MCPENGLSSMLIRRSPCRNFAARMSWTIESFLPASPSLSVVVDATAVEVRTLLHFICTSDLMSSFSTILLRGGKDCLHMIILLTEINIFFVMCYVPLIVEIWIKFTWNTFLFLTGV